MKILKQKGNYTLIDMKTKYVVAYKYNPITEEWEHGHYFDFDNDITQEGAYYDALEFFNLNTEIEDLY